jgi:hypothetical protein
MTKKIIKSNGYDEAIQDVLDHIIKLKKIAQAQAKDKKDKDKMFNLAEIRILISIQAWLYVLIASKVDAKQEDKVFENKKKTPITDLVKALKEDENYLGGWIANIAMSFYDVFQQEGRGYLSMVRISRLSNKAAKNFMDQLMRDDYKELQEKCEEIKKGLTND